MFTACKRSLGQGNMFYTCLSFCSGGFAQLPWMQTPSPWMQTPSPWMQTPSPWMQTPPQCRSPPPPDADPFSYGQQAGGTHPTGMHTCLTFIFPIVFVGRVVAPGEDPPRGCPPGTSRFHDMCVRFGGPVGLGVNGGVITNAVTGSGEINVEINVEQTINYTSVTLVSCFSLFVPFQFLMDWKGHLGSIL